MKTDRTSRKREKSRRTAAEIQYAAQVGKSWQFPTVLKFRTVLIGKITLKTRPADPEKYREE
jgi:hypothetical protein